MNKNVDFYYFSGTGNTKFIVNHTVKSLESFGIGVSLKLIENGYDSLESASEIWVAFPVNAQSMSPFIWRFFKSLPYSKGTKVFVMVTLNESAHVLSPLYSLLTNKGYAPASSCEIKMPNNMVDTDFCQDKNREMLIAASKKADRFICDTMASNFLWKSEFKGSKFISFLTRETPLPWVSMRLMLRLETTPTRCIGCGICANQCPVRNIKKVNQILIHGHNCQFCMKCAAICPNKAIKVSRKENIKFQYTQNIIF
ncbi:Ferredoxin [Paenibacillus sophorae]|uniref:EFR1 family ferrodoxin n=1 Tax=Paenibacillus sophorae TaxID=1333845 RepID=A0A1H8QXJ4_9BACL|nr:EFR1 family ferrodoxin [Paenibacillus sophorae]QWU14857.1 EFR1 family ferrodoxin [Paenibacillus sophorae]SEO58433.1 Ferredoxin [Paenibacillus sophorae]